MTTIKRGGLVFEMKPKSLGLLIETRRQLKALTALLPVEEDAWVKDEIEQAAGAYTVLSVHTHKITCEDGNPTEQAFAAWFNSNTSNVLAHFDAYIVQPEAIINEWDMAYALTNASVLSIESKPPQALTDQERAELDDPKAKATKNVGSGSLAS